MTLSDDDKKAFEDAMEGVKAYAPRKKTIEKSSQPLKRIQPSLTHLEIRKNATKPLKEKIIRQHHTPSVTAHDTLSYNKTGIPAKKILQKNVEATLDLHELTSDEALIQTRNFISRCQQQGLRTLRIIHGKGLYSNPDSPILKNLINQFLRTHEAVVAFQSEKNNTGAVVVIITRARA